MAGEESGVRVEQVAWPAEQAAEDLAHLRASAPLTHCLTNFVAAPLTANVLLAAGAIPAMIPAAEEAEPFAAAAGAVLINIGTITASGAEAMRVAARAARRAGTPWVLDPVAVGGLPLRDRMAAELLDHGPAVIRGNGSEIAALAGAVAHGRGPESTASSAIAIEAGRGLARRTGAVVAISGEVDYVVDGNATIAIPGGDTLLTKVTGAGCALGALIAAFTAAAPTPRRAAVAASAVFAAAGERAAAGATGPGGFAVALLDELALIGA